MATTPKVIGNGTDDQAGTVLALFVLVTHGMCQP
jgi:hypothetical protein